MARAMAENSKKFLDVNGVGFVIYRFKAGYTAYEVDGFDLEYNHISEPFTAKTYLDITDKLYRHTVNR